MIKVGINGFGRIGRIVCRIGLLKHADEIEFAAINTSGSMDIVGWAMLEFLAKGTLPGIEALLC